MNNIPTENTEKRKAKVQRKLSSVYNLPALPFLIMEVSKMIEDPKTNAAQLGEVLRKDQGLVTKILTVANSPLYGIPRRVSTIEFAIIILGFNHIKNIVIALSMMESLKTKGSKQFHQKNFWIHSLMTATAAKKIADDLGYHTSGEAFTMGLLHDLGIPIIYKYFPKEYDQIVELVENENKSFLEAENEVLGMTHQDIGAYLIDKWNLPETLSSVISVHHTPTVVEEKNISAAVVHLADYMTNKLNVGEFDWDSEMKLDEGIIETLNMGSEEYLSNFIDSYEEQFKNQLESISL